MIQFGQFFNIQVATATTSFSRNLFYGSEVCSFCEIREKKVADLLIIDHEAEWRNGFTGIDSSYLEMLLEAQAAILEEMAISIESPNFLKNVWELLVRAVDVFFHEAPNDTL